MNIETVQRWVASVILIHVGSVPAVTLAVYSIGVAGTDYGKGVGLWIMSGVIGLLTVAGVLAIFRRSAAVAVARSPASSPPRSPASTSSDGRGRRGARLAVDGAGPRVAGGCMAQQVQAQQVLAPPAKAAIFLVLTVRPGAEKAVRAVLADVAALTRSVGFKAPDDELSCVVGIGAAAVGPAVRRSAAGRSASVAGVDRRAAHRARRRPGDLLFHLRARRIDLCFELAGHLMNRLAGPATSSTRSTDSGTSTSATCSASSTAPRTRGARPRSPRSRSATRIRRSPAAATSSCRSTCTTWTPGTRCPSRSRSA